MMLQNDKPLNSEAPSPLPAPSGGAGEVERYRRIVGLLQEMWGEKDQSTLTANCFLAFELYKQGELRESGEIFLKVLGEMERDPGFDDPNTLVLATKLAIIWRDTGELDAAETLFHRILATLQSASAPDEDLLIINWMAFGKLLESLDRLQESADLYQKALSGRNRLLGPEHKRTLSSANRLAGVLEKMQPISVESRK